MEVSGGSTATILPFLKQEHLQKEGAATGGAGSG